MINTSKNIQDKKKIKSKRIKQLDSLDKSLNNITENSSNSSPENNNTAQKSLKNINIVIPSDEQNKKIKNNDNEKKISSLYKEKEKEKINLDELIKEKEIEKEKLLKAQKRLNIINILNSDNFAENYMYYPSKNEITKFQQNSDYIIPVPYSALFYDHIYLRDESIFFIYDKTQKLKFLDKTDIEKILREETQLNFGKDPSDIYYKILRGNNNDLINIEQLQEHLNNFNLFKCRIPNYMKIDLDNFRNNYIYNELAINSHNESENSTRINSRINNRNNENIQLNQKELIFNNEIYNENFINEENNNDSNKKSFIQKKRKLKK